ncbi:MAG: pre-peptidase C-terminal domain-containing protein, partial [Planctomycetes bacterium]|nr:pre-peptidase C-terminal domain-containing protein [Planctomycetota bacterium]
MTSPKKATLVAMIGVLLGLTGTTWSQVVLYPEADLVDGRAEAGANPPRADQAPPVLTRPAPDGVIVGPQSLDPGLDPPPGGRVSLEPNDTFAEATDTGLAFDGTVIVLGAYLGNGDFPDRDVDFYSFEVPAGAQLPKRLTVRVERDPARGSAQVESPRTKILGQGMEVADRGHRGWVPSLVSPVERPPEGLVYTNEPLPDALDGYLRVFDASGVEIVNNDDEQYPDLDPQCSTYLLSAGVYYVGVSASGNALYDVQLPDSGMTNTTAGTYDLWLTVEPGAVPDEALEPNDLFADATDTGGGSYQALGRFIGDGAQDRRDVDVFRVTLTGPAIIEARADVDPLDSTLDPVLSLRSAIGTHAVNDNADLDTRDARLEVALLEAGDYYVVVTGAGNFLPIFDPYYLSVGLVGYYDLTIEVTPLAGAGGPYEPNDSILRATPVSVSAPGSTVLSAFAGDGAYADSRGDFDFYEIQAYPGEMLTVEVSAAGGGLDPIVVVHDYLGMPLASNDNYAGTTDSRLTVEARKPTSDTPAWLYVMVLGTRQPRPLDPFVPNPDTYLTQARSSEHVVIDADPSTGPYTVTFTLDALPAHDCCDTHATPGCSDPVIEACVCESSANSNCCSWDWSYYCVQLVTDEDCGRCTGGGPRGEDGPSTPVSSPTLARTVAWVPGVAQSVIPDRLFATALSFPAKHLLELDPADGTVLAQHDIPEALVSTAQGLALLDDTLFFLGAGRFPKLYWLDPDTAAVLQHTYLWSGSGYYGDLAVHDGHLFLTDVFDRTLHEFDPAALVALRTIDVGALNGIAISGAMASLGAPDRLYLADAFDLGTIHAIDPVTGLLDGSLSTGVPCPCNADFDFDGDVDADDQTFFDDCDAFDGTVPYSCRQVDLNCDQVYDGADQAILDCQNNGPDNPPHPDCCTAGLPTVPVRATALGGIGTDGLFVNDWNRESLEAYDRAGNLLNLWPGGPYGAIGGQPLAAVGIAEVRSCLDHSGTIWCLTLTEESNTEPRLPGLNSLAIDLTRDVGSNGVVGVAIDCTPAGPYVGNISTAIGSGPQGLHSTVVIGLDPTLPTKNCCIVTLTGDLEAGFQVRILAG